MDLPNVSRRQFLTATAAAVAAASTAAESSASGGESKFELSEGAIVLFQGDSITDAGRDRRSNAANNARSLGRGYPLLIGSELLRDQGDPAMKVFNKGISGNKVPDLDARWEQDCLALKPDVLSILIGVNDIWHKLNGRYDGTVATYESGFRALLERTRKALPATRIVICEPFVLRCGAVKDNWFPEFDQRRAAAKKVADEAKLTFVPFQTMFDEATKTVPPAYWAGDGVHPTIAGHSLMAQTWRKVVGV